MKETTYLVETWRNEPYREVLEDDFDNEKEAIEYAEAISHLLGVECTKVFSLTCEDCGLYTKEVRVKIAEFE